MIKTVIKFFDKLEDKIRGRLSKYPLIYAFIGSIGIVLLWRGIWVIVDSFDETGIISTILGFVILGSTGLLVSFFVGDQIIISGIKQEKRIDEKTEDEIMEEAVTLLHIHDDVGKIKSEIQRINQKMSEKNKK
jgi:ascorbate-specific PTS system EIIC-type component UlaA